MEAASTNTTKATAESALAGRVSRSKSDSRSTGVGHKNTNAGSHSRSRRYHSNSSSNSRSRSKSRSHSNHRRKSHSRSHSHSRSRSRRYHSRSRSYSPAFGRHSRSPMSSRRRHHGSRQINPEPSLCLGVFGLSLHTSEKNLREVFSRYGPLNSVNIVYDQQSGRSRGFAFVYFENVDDSKEAKERANGMELDGRYIRVDYSITKRPHTPTPGIYMGRPTYPNRRDNYHERSYDREYDRSDDRGYDRHNDHGYDDYGGDRCDRYRRRSPSPYYSRGGSRSQSYSPRRY